MLEYLVEITLCAFYHPPTQTRNVSRTSNVYVRRPNIVTPAVTELAVTSTAA